MVQRGQRTTCRNLFSPSTVRGPEIELTSADLVPSVLSVALGFWSPSIRLCFTDLLFLPFDLLPPCHLSQCLTQVKT